MVNINGKTKKCYWSKLNPLSRTSRYYKNGCPMNICNTGRSQKKKKSQWFKQYLGSSLLCQLLVTITVDS